jgi:selenide,water dikinase
MTQAVRLTSLSHGGGCGCKLSPAALTGIMAAMPLPAVFPDLLVGTDTSDDAAVWKLNEHQALVATTDFFMPVVDDPRDFGRIAATNALSDVYAMGGMPIMALAIVGMPVDRLSPEVIGAILAGGAEVCAKAGVPVAGGHSIDSVEPIYGLVALGLVHPGRVLTNRGGRAGDVLVLTKGLGVGVFSAAFKQERLDAAGYEAMIASTTLLNAVGGELGQVAGVHAVTDVTGFGLLGHGLEMARGSGLSVEIDFSRVPLLPGAEALARSGVRTGASGRNWASYGEAVRLPEGLDGWKRDLLTDPQTSGGLLIAVDPSQAAEVVELARDHGAGLACEIGRLRRGPAEVVVKEG